MTSYIDSTKIRLTEQASAPATPGAGTSIIYVKADGLFYTKDDAGAELQLGASSFGVTGDTGSDTINSGDTLDFENAGGLKTVVSANKVSLSSAWDYESVLGANGSFDVTLNTIATWDTSVKSIELEVALRSTVVATTDSMYIFFNNDTTVTNYYRQTHGASGGAAAVGQANDPTFCSCPGSTSPASSFTLGKLYIASPNSTAYKKAAKVELIGQTDTSVVRQDNGGVVWVTGGTAAITRIQIRTSTNPTTLLATNSYLRMKFIR